MAMMVGGGMNTGQVIGLTDRYASEEGDPSHQDVIATLYHNIELIRVVPLWRIRLEAAYHQEWPPIEELIS